MKKQLNTLGILFLVLIVLFLIIETLFLVNSRLALNNYNKSQICNDLDGVIRGIQEIDVSDALLYQTDTDAIESIKESKDRYSAYKVTIEINNNSVVAGNGVERLDWFVLPGTTCQASSLSDYSVVGDPYMGDAFLTVYHAETPSSLSDGKKEYTLFLIINTSKKSEKEIQDTLDRITINIQTDIYINQSTFPVYRTFTPVRWN